MRNTKNQGLSAGSDNTRSARGADMKKNQYYYAVTRVHNNEATLLTDQALERLRQAGGMAECMTVLREHGWAADQSMPVQEVVEARREMMWSFLDELGVSDMLDFFRYEHDFNSLKAVIRLQYAKRTQEFGARYISKFGILPEQVLRDCMLSGSFDALPEPFRAAAQEAQRVLLQTGNGQLSDAILDRVCLDTLWAEACRVDSEALRRYAQMRADGANIQIVLRGLGMSRTKDFFELAVANHGRLPKAALCAAAAKGIDAVNAYLATSEYTECVSAAKGSIPALLAGMGSRLMTAIRPLKGMIGGSEPIYAFVMARENELNMVRLLLSSKVNQFPEGFVTGCLGRMYA